MKLEFSLSIYLIHIMPVLVHGNRNKERLQRLVAIRRFRLDNEVQKSYQYYEWNDEMGWYKYFLLLLERVRWQRDNWESLYSRGPKIQKLRLIFTIL